MNNEFDATGKLVTPTVGESVRTLVDTSSETIDAIKTRLGDVTDNVKQGGSAAVDRTQSYIQANPYKSLLIAFGAGYVAMRIKTSPLFKVGMLGVLAYLGTSIYRR